MSKKGYIKELAKRTGITERTLYSRIFEKGRAMKLRCYNEHSEKYKNYGGRGIAVGAEWKDDFMAFYKWAMDNGYRDNLTIDRIDVNGNYEPNNCRWATYKQQARNKQYHKDYTINGVTKCLAEWCEIWYCIR